MSILIKERKFLGTKTWLSPRNGRQTRAQYSSWRTIAKVEAMPEAQSLILRQFVGLDQRAAFSKGKIVITKEGRYV